MDHVAEQWCQFENNSNSLLLFKILNWYKAKMDK